jgi:hypothetical protein
MALSFDASALRIKRRDDGYAASAYIAHQWVLLFVSKTPGSFEQLRKQSSHGLSPPS